MHPQEEQGAQPPPAPVPLPDASHNRRTAWLSGTRARVALLVGSFWRRPAQPSANAFGGVELVPSSDLAEEAAPPPPAVPPPAAVPQVVVEPPLILDGQQQAQVSPSEDDPSYQQLLFFAGLLVGPLLFSLGAFLFFITPSHLKSLRRWGLANVVMTILSLGMTIFFSVTNLSDSVLLVEHVETIDVENHRFPLPPLEAGILMQVGINLGSLVWNETNFGSWSQLGSDCEGAVNYGLTSVDGIECLGPLAGVELADTGWGTSDDELLCGVFAGPEFDVLGTLVWRVEYGPGEPPPLHSADGSSRAALPLVLYVPGDANSAVRTRYPENFMGAVLSCVDAKNQSASFIVSLEQSSANRSATISFRAQVRVFQSESPSR